MPNACRLLAAGSGLKVNALAQALTEEDEVTLHAADTNDSNWLSGIESYDAVLYVSEEGNLDELQQVSAACRVAGVPLMPAVFVRQIGLIGPLIEPESGTSWESAWRRLHQAAFRPETEQVRISPQAGALMANVLVNEWLRLKEEGAEAEGARRFYLLQPDTLTGDWYPFVPHPLVDGLASAAPINDIPARLNVNRGSANGDAGYFQRLTSRQTGIFHRWDEGDLPQLPLALCGVQPVDPISAGPAELLPLTVGSGLTHEEAAHDAAFAGIEQYIRRLADDQSGADFIGAGFSFAEGVSRALLQLLECELSTRTGRTPPKVIPYSDWPISDTSCHFYMQAIVALTGILQIGIGEPLYGVPTAWTNTEGQWYGSVGFTTAQAQRRSLQLALLHIQAPGHRHTVSGAVTTATELEDGAMEYPVNPREASLEMQLQEAIQTFAEHGKQLVVHDMTLDPALKEGLAGVFAVQLKEVKAV